MLKVPVRKIDEIFDGLLYLFSKNNICFLKINCFYLSPLATWVDKTILKHFLQNHDFFRIVSEWFHAFVSWYKKTRLKIYWICLLTLFYLIIYFGLIISNVAKFLAIVISKVQSKRPIMSKYVVPN